MIPEKMKDYQFKPGQSGNINGRPKKKLARVDEILAQLKIDPTQKILDLLPELRPREQLQAWMELLSYCQAKPKPMVEKDELGDLTNVELVKLAEQALEQLKAS